MVMREPSLCRETELFDYFVHSDQPVDVLVDGKRYPITSIHSTRTSMEIQYECNRESKQLSIPKLDDVFLDMYFFDFTFRLLGREKELKEYKEHVMKIMHPRPKAITNDYLWVLATRQHINDGKTHIVYNSGKKQFDVVDIIGYRGAIRKPDGGKVIHNHIDLVLDNDKTIRIPIDMNCIMMGYYARVHNIIVKADVNGVEEEEVIYIAKNPKTLGGGG